MIIVVLRRILRRFLHRLFALTPRQAMLGGLGLVVAGVVVFGGLYLLSPRSAAGVSGSTEMSVDGLQQNPTTGQVMLVLKEKAGNRRIAMVVGDIEARTIFVELQGMQSERPMTYDLMREMVTKLDAQIRRVVVNHVTESTFYAKVILSANGRELEVDSRPSDAVALALRAKAPIYADAAVLEKAGINSPN